MESINYACIKRPLHAFVGLRILAVVQVGDVMKKQITALSVIFVSIIALAGGAWAQGNKKNAPQKASLSFSDSEIRISAFSGNNIRVGALWTVDAACKSPQPDIRIVKQPKNGEVTFQEYRAAIALPEKNGRAHCNGKTANGVHVQYQSREDYSGTEQFQIEVDYKLGFVRSYTVYVNVR
jgi:hypothetical protein